MKAWGNYSRIRSWSLMSLGVLILSDDFFLLGEASSDLFLFPRHWHHVKKEKHFLLDLGFSPSSRSFDDRINQKHTDQENPRLEVALALETTKNKTPHKIPGLEMPSQIVKPTAHRRQNTARPRPRPQPRPTEEVPWNVGRR